MQEIISYRNEISLCPKTNNWRIDTSTIIIAGTLFLSHNSFRSKLIPLINFVIFGKNYWRNEDMEKRFLGHWKALEVLNISVVLGYLVEAMDCMVQHVNICVIADWRRVGNSPSLIAPEVSWTKIQKLHNEKQYRLYGNTFLLKCKEILNFIFFHIRVLFSS